MSATTFGHKGLEAVQKKDWAGAISSLDKALESSNSPAWLLARAHASYQLKNYDASLHDAELAYHIAAERGSGNSRKLMIDAQYRRATICFKLGRYADSDCCAKWSMLLAEGRPAREDDGVERNVDEAGRYTVTYADGIADKKGQPGQESNPALATMTSTPRTGFESEWNRGYAWRSQALGALKGLAPEHPGWAVNVTKVPSKPQNKVKKVEPVEVDSDEEDIKVASASSEKDAKKPGPALGSVPDEKMKLRVDFYQTSTTVTVSLFVKDVKKDTLQVDFTRTQARIRPIPREAAPYVKSGDREATSTLALGGDIVPLGSRWSATPRKIELTLQKAAPGTKWGSWGEEKIGPESFHVADIEPPAASNVVSNENTKPEAAAAPAYPTSSKSGPKDWDKLGDDDDDEEEEGKSDVNFFFKQLYKGATPEQQRAMMKSFVESNGTALSTDWNDVKSRTVETIPPEGIEAKKWET
ncbi:SGS domain-containing protein [Lasiosphaeria hispida]|uniref:SGS domain-containing protein n=1 Tax=Lasiosphaeria hispida TaxID=260671 RepID=A0AAJ0HQJ6_9PEZI|nr:SGS domain-containing protein [Lasiosphaeria hispida]